jgi:hypothetical protein
MAKTSCHCPRCNVSFGATAIVGAEARCPYCGMVVRVEGAVIEVSGQNAEEVLSVADGLINSLWRRKPPVPPAADLRAPNRSHRSRPEVRVNREISDVAAINFAASFYGALAFGRSVKKAFEQGLARLKAEGVSEAETPKLLVRTGVDASKLFVVGSHGNLDPIQIPGSHSIVASPQNADLVGPGADIERPQAAPKPQAVMVLGVAIAVVAVALVVSGWPFGAARPLAPAAPPAPQNIARAAEAQAEQDLKKGQKVEHKYPA